MLHLRDLGGRGVLLFELVLFVINALFLCLLILVCVGLLLLLRASYLFW